MSETIVPEKKIITCDRCGASAERGRGAFECGGVHGKNIEHWGKGYDGATGGISLSLDLCAACGHAFNEFLSAPIKRVILLVNKVHIVHPKEQTLFKLADDVMRAGLSIGGDMHFEKGSKVSIKVEVE